MSTNICDFASLLFWAVIAICVLVCCLEIRKEIRERRAADALARQQKIDDWHWAERVGFAKAIDAKDALIADLRTQIYILKRENERIARQCDRQKQSMNGVLVVDVRKGAEKVGN